MVRKFRWLIGAYTVGFVSFGSGAAAQPIPDLTRLPASVKPAASLPAQQDKKKPTGASETAVIPFKAKALRSIDLKSPTAPKALKLGDFKLNVVNIDAPDNPIIQRYDRLKRLGPIVNVKPVETSVSELSTGLFINQTLRFDVKLGACRTAASQLAEAGLDCGTASSLASRLQALSNPADTVSYIPNAAARQKVIAELTAVATELRSDVQNTRTFLASSEALDALGAAEVARLSALDDDSLVAEVINSGTTEITQSIYLPALDKLDALKIIKNLNLQPFNVSPQVFQAGLKNLNPENISKIEINQSQIKSAPMRGGSMPPKTVLMAHQNREPTLLGGLSPEAMQLIQDYTPPQSAEATGGDAPNRSQGDQTGSRAVSKSAFGRIGKDIFLAGFTLGKEYEWKTRIQKSVNWCWVGCTRTYYIEPYAKLGFGLGLRFPIEEEFYVHYTNGIAGRNPKVKIKLKAIEGKDEDYQAAGLESAKLFSNKELVAQYAYKAGIRYSLPNYSGDWSIGDEYDFTTKLPRPFTNGQFTPPSPGRDLLTFQKVFNELDLLQRQADYGIVSAKLFPAVKVNLTSNELSMMVTDLTQRGVERRLSDDDTLIVGTNANRELSVKVSQPKYNLAFKITPGLNYRLNVDLAVWGHTWSDTIWIPSLEIELPPGGVDFGCHAGTVCERTYKKVVRYSDDDNNTAPPSQNSQPGQSERGVSVGSSPSSVSTDGDCRINKIPGYYALRDPVSGKFVRGGVTAEKQNDLVGLGDTNYARNVARDWATFELFEISGVRGGHRFRNTIDGRWLETNNTTSTLLLPQGRQCSAANLDMQWRFEDIPGGHFLRSQRTGYYVRLDRDGLLKADANRATASKFELVGNQ